jgi:hypothetical protein
MIRISIGNVGSGKTASEVRELCINRAHRRTYSNIVTSDLANVTTLKPDMIIKKELIGTKKKRDGTEEPIHDLKVNYTFWQGIKEPINIVLDEAHSILNARRAMSKTNVIITDWLALIRKILGENSVGVGELVFVTQLPRRLDPIARDMARQVRYHICHYRKTCRRCRVSWGETSEMPEPLWICPACGSHELLKHGHVIEVHCYASIKMYEAWEEWGIDKGRYKKYYITDIEDYFRYFDTMQWDNLFSEFY